MLTKYCVKMIRCHRNKCVDETISYCLIVSAFKVLYKLKKINEEVEGMDED